MIPVRTPVIFVKSQAIDKSLQDLITWVLVFAAVYLFIKISFEQGGSSGGSGMWDFLSEKEKSKRSDKEYEKKLEREEEITRRMDKQIEKERIAESRDAAAIRKKELDLAKEEARIRREEVIYGGPILDMSEDPDDPSYG